jgi:tRNA-dihydrouridine synthase
VIVHARSCVLKGLSPAQNRTIPPLQYDCVYRLREDFPSTNLVLNGGIESFEAAETILSFDKISGVMIGRAAYKHPWMFATADERFYGRPHRSISRAEVLAGYLDYCSIAQQRGDYGSSTANMLKPMHYFFHGAGQGNIAYKQSLDILTKQHAHDHDHSIQDIVYAAIQGNIPTSFLEC